ncbi:MAG: YgaP family membrane protein [Acidovorax sp.]
MPFLQSNVGVWDRATRLAAGVLLISLAAMGAIGPWGYIGFVLLVTGIMGTCPIYSLIDFSTFKRQKP